ncbi:MAG: hypothetical protein EAZ42_04980 [Verrucomicrobia bacterium]|nr:MAG: hypothetical protein EAZ42_04980 [Verrucomicrobiota bacterium]
MNSLLIYFVKSFSIPTADSELEEMLYGSGDFESTHDGLIRSLMPFLLLNEPLDSNQHEKLLFEHLAKIGSRHLVLTLCEEAQGHLTIISARSA